MKCPYLNVSDTAYCSATDPAYVPSAFELKEYCTFDCKMCPFYRIGRAGEEVRRR